MNDKLIKLPCFGIVVELTDFAGHGRWNGASISSNLKDDLTGENDDEYLSMVDAIESLIMAHAAEGIAINSHAYVAGIETAFEAIANHT